VSRNGMTPYPLADVLLRPAFLPSCRQSCRRQAAGPVAAPPGGAGVWARGECGLPFAATARHLGVSTPATMKIPWKAEGVVS